MPDDEPKPEDIQPKQEDTQSENAQPDVQEPEKKEEVKEEKVEPEAEAMKEVEEITNNKKAAFEPKPEKPGRVWKTLTFILGIMLVLSILTHGFRFGPTGKAVNSFKAIVLNDQRCKECDVTQLKAQLSMILPGIEFEELDYSDPKGKKLYEKLNLQYLPVVLFNKDVENQAAYAQLQPYLDEVGDYYSLRIGAEFDPTKEICDNGIDDTGNGLVDCDDPDCANSVVCRPEEKAKLDLFIMSQCPFGMQAVNLMKEVLDAFGNDIEFDIHYIANEISNGTFVSLHGPAEVEENIRQLCAKKYYKKGNKYLDYIWCRNKDIQSKDWENCAKKAGIDADKIKKCAEGDEGKKLLSEDIKIAQELKIGASPTFLVNNKYAISGVDESTGRRTAEAIKQQFCQYNPNLKGCSKTLSTESTASSGSC
ncbi:hypothetical protein DRZ77_00080 [Candidatus Woesearchaeota archaeon]|nr:DsbA family protein [Candidatus Woesearchaeota archaeon]RLE41133.1 MAG: hypothetical protein DRZ77_00080 [Candidatus Woesearchaeota archaeon]